MCPKLALAPAFSFCSHIVTFSLLVGFFLYLVVVYIFTLRQEVPWLPPLFSRTSPPYLFSFSNLSIPVKVLVTKIFHLRQFWHRLLSWDFPRLHFNKLLLLSFRCLSPPFDVTRFSRQVPFLLFLFLIAYLLVLDSPFCRTRSLFSDMDSKIRIERVFPPMWARASPLFVKHVLSFLFLSCLSLLNELSHALHPYTGSYLVSTCNRLPLDFHLNLRERLSTIPPLSPLSPEVKYPHYGPQFGHSFCSSWEVSEEPLNSIQF